MILAAGYGTRLAPLTDHVPKPLLPVDGQSLLDHAIASLVAAGIEEIAVNTHHLGQMIADRLAGRADSARFTLFPEQEILGTGGALDGAREFLARADHFVIHNGDVLCNADLGALLADHLTAGALATLLLCDWPEINSVAIDAEGSVRRVGGDSASDPADWTRLTYTGVGVFRRDLLADIGPGFSSLIDPLIRAKDLHPGRVRGFVQKGLSWSDLGTPARYLEALPGDEASPSGAVQVHRITGHGSQRRFWRLGGPDFSLVAMVSPAEDEEFERFCDIGRWLHAEGLGAPDILSANPVEKSVLMQDLGSESLFDLAARVNPGPLYEKVVDHLLLLQGRTDRARATCPAAVDRVLDRAVLRWETDYFRERFLAGHCGLKAAELADLTPEFEELATATGRQPLVLIHRDFQSQNIHLTGGQVGLVDFQGMRLGPIGYDIMSLVMDPYVDLPAALKAGLVERFCLATAGDHAPEELEAMTVSAGLQRIMQALGAFGFLGHVRGKTAFLAHIPRALDHLDFLLGEVGRIQEEGSSAQKNWLPAGGLPRLTRLVQS
jgi:aminoglycoside/choline kinase family phosphotransferase